MATKKLQILDSLIKQAENANTLDGKHASDFLNTITLTTVFDENFNVLVTTDATTIPKDFATDYKDNAKYVFVPSSVTRVDAGAFYYCTNITDAFIDNIRGGILFMSLENVDTNSSISAFPASTNLHYVKGGNTLQGLLSQIHSKSDKSAVEQLQAFKEYENRLYVDDYIKQHSGLIDEGINSCIEAAISMNKEVVFGYGKTYELNSPLNIDNTTDTTKPIRIDFNNSHLALNTDVDTEFDYVVCLNCGSRNGTVVSFIKNINIDASNAQYGIYADKSIRMRMENINIKNGAQKAIYINSGIETFIDKFSLWRTESANVPTVITDDSGHTVTTYPNSVGIDCQATDSYLSNGVIVNYMTACKSGGAVTWKNCHPWWYYTDDDTYNIHEVNNKAVMEKSVCFEVEGQTIIDACEFDSGSICVKSLDTKSPIMIDNCMFILSPMYINSKFSTPTIVSIESGDASNITITNLNFYQSYPFDTYLCNRSMNNIKYDYSEKTLLNLPKEDIVYNNAAATVSGEDIQVIATEVTIKNSPSYVFVSNTNLMPCIKPIGSMNGITAYKDSDNTIHLNGTATTTFNYYLAGGYASTTPIMLLKSKTRYCISRPNHDGIMLRFLNDSTVVYSLTGIKGNPYQYYYQENTEMEITGICLNITAGTTFDNFIFKPYVNLGTRPSRYEKSNAQIITDYTNTIDCDGYTLLSCKSGETVEISYKNGNIADMNDIQTLSEQIEILETNKADKGEVDTALSGKLDNTTGSVATDNIANKAVTNDKIANGAITALKLANGAVSGSNIAQNQISTNHLQSEAVTSDKIANGAISEAKLESKLLSKLSYVTPQMYGAVGDGVTDDTDAIQSAMNYVTANGGSLRFPGDTTYIISKPIQIITYQKSFEIDFGYSTITCGSEFNSDTINSEEVNSAFYIYTNSTNQKRIGTIKNLIIDGKYENIHTGLYLKLSSKIYYENINLIDVRRGIYFKKGVESFFDNIHMSRSSGIDITSDIDLETTDCIGIDCYATDNHFSNIIVIDFVIGMNFRLGSGDNRVYGAHVWNYYCKTQYKKSVCFMNSGSNFYTNCVADHFFVGWYIYGAGAMYLNGCNITCKLVKDNSNNIIPLNSYAFYFGDSYAKNRIGSDIIVDNTRINGEANDYNESVTLTFSNISDCNINYSGVAQNCEKAPVPNMPVMVSGKTVIDDANNSKINQYGGIKSVEKVLEFEECSTDFSDITDKTYTSGGWLSNYLYVGSRTSVAVSGNFAEVLSASGATGYNYLNLYLSDSDGDKPRTLGLKNGDLIMISYKYKTNSSSKVATFTSDSLTPYTSDDKVSSLTGDGAWHNAYRFFTVSKTTSAKIAFGDYNTVDLDNALYLTDIRVINLSKYNIPKYYLETDKAYRARLIKLFGTTYATSVTIPARNDISFASIPYRFICTDVSSESDQMVGFSSLGKPIILTRTSDYKFNYIYNNDTPSSITFELSKYTIDQSGAIDTNKIEVYIDNTKIYMSTDSTPELHNWSYTKNIAVPSGSTLKLVFTIPAGKECMFSKLVINPYNLSNIPIIDATDGYSKIPLYADGEICLVAKNKSGEDLPTAYFEVIYSKPYYVLTDTDKSEIANIAISNIADGAVTSEKIANGAISEAKLESKLLSKLSYVTPQMYGAKGDGISDDTSAVQAALNTGQSVYIPKGVYKVGKLIISNGKGARIYGDGCGNTILKHNDAYISDDCIIQISDDSNCILSSFSIFGGGSDIIDDGTYTGTKYHGIIISNCSNNSENVIENIDIYKCLGDGLHLSNSAIGCRISNIHTYYNVGCGLYNEGYGNKVVNLDTHQNHSDGICIWAGGFNGTNIKSWGNLRDGINMDNMWSHIAAVVLYNVSVQQNGRHGLMMTNCESCVITGLQSLANNYKSKSKLNDGETLYSKTAGLLMVDGNHNNYIQGNIISSYAYWNSFEENSVRISGKDNTNNIIDLTVNSSLMGPDMYEVCFKPLSYTDSDGNNHNLYNYNKLPEYSILRQTYSNPLNTIKINGEVVSDKTMTNVANNNIYNESFMKKSDGTTNVISVSSDISSGILSLTLSDYADLPAKTIDNITYDTGNIDVGKLAYRRGYSLPIIKGNANKVLYLRLTAKVSEYKAFGIIPLVHIMYKADDGTTKYAYLDISADYIKSNIIFNTDYITKNIALDLGDYVGKDITIYLRLCATKLSDKTISNVAIQDTATIDIKEFSYKLC